MTSGTSRPRGTGAPEVEPVVIGLGGNVGTETEITERFGRARAALAELGPLRSARLYRSAPIGPDQPWFLNTAVCIAAGEIRPAALLASILAIEHQLGRRRRDEPRWGPRPIDLDVLVWGARALRTPELELPHPRLVERRFALLPLIDLLGARFVIPGRGTAGALARGVADQRCDEVAERW